jgi:GTP cyclohydrolase I
MDASKIEEAVLRILEAVGEDPQREGLVDTPKRVARMYQELLSGTSKDPRDEITVTYGEQYDEIIAVRDIPFYSICEHHLLPFHGRAHVAYLPQGGRISGLSKLLRVIDVLSKRLQLQERLTRQIAETLMAALQPRGVMIIVEAEHLCMSMRGVKKPGAITVTSAVEGIFRANEATREEALRLLKG